MYNDVGAFIMKEYNLLHWVFAYIHVGIGAITGSSGVNGNFIMYF